MISGLEGLVMDLGSRAPTINRTDTLEVNLRLAPLTFERPTLSYLYIENGLIRTAIDQPVDDAVRGGVDLESPELDADEIKLIVNYLEEKGVWDSIKTTMKWGRLFGGAGMIINNGQDPGTRLLRHIQQRRTKIPVGFDEPMTLIRRPKQGHLLLAAAGLLPGNLAHDLFIEQLFQFGKGNHAIIQPVNEQQQQRPHPQPNQTADQHLLQ